MARVYEWDKEKNRKLIRERRISFEAIITNVEGGGLLAVARGKGKFAHQKQLLVAINNYVYIVPCVEDEKRIFLKTIIPSRKLTKQYLAGGRLT